MGTLLRSAQSVIGGVIGSVFSFFITLMLSAYILITKDDILGFFRSMARPSKRTRFDDLIARIDGGLTGVVRGQLLIAVVNGVLSGIGFWIADLRYWPILALVATVLSVIPIFGAILSSIPAVIVGLQDSVWTALFVLVWIVGIHQIEANLLNPKIMGDAAKVHPVLVVFALLAASTSSGSWARSSPSRSSRSARACSCTTARSPWVCPRTPRSPPSGPRPPWTATECPRAGCTFTEINLPPEQVASGVNA